MRIAPSCASDRRRGTVCFASASQPLLGETVAERAAPCLACHGESGQSETPEIPSLGGQPAPYLLIQLYMFREKQRASALKEGRSDDPGHVRDDEGLHRRRPAKFLRLSRQAAGAETASRYGRSCAACSGLRALITQHRCNSCHSLDLTGRENVPRIANQREDYLAKTLRDYKSNDTARLRWCHGRSAGAGERRADRRSGLLHRALSLIAISVRCREKTGPHVGPGFSHCRRGGRQFFQRGTCCPPAILGGYPSGGTASLKYAKRTGAATSAAA